MIPEKKWLMTEDPNIMFEGDNAVGLLKKQIWDASEEEIDAILEEYEGLPRSRGMKLTSLSHR